MTRSRPLRYRAASYHAAFVEEGTLSEVAALGFNAIELQVEGDTMRGLEDLRRREDKLGFMKEAKSLGLEIAIWTHEFSGLDPSVIGPISVSNPRVWQCLRDRYRAVCRDLLPETDYWVLTVVETEQNATEPDLLRTLVETINDEVSAAGKTLIFRSFVWHPAEMGNVVKAMHTMPANVWFHTKYVPQDWHFRSIDNPLIGRFPGRTEIVEYGIAGEYIRERHLATCVADDLVERHKLWHAKGVGGVSVRVNRFAGDWEESNSAFDSLQESTLWVTMPYVCGEPVSVEEGLRRYGARRFGENAAAAVAAALRDTGAVNMEALCVERETFGDPRSSVPADSTFRLAGILENMRKNWKQDYRIPADLDLTVAPALPYPDDEDFHYRNPFYRNWSAWRWDSGLYPAYRKLRCGDPDCIVDKEQHYAAARRSALASLAIVDDARDRFDDSEQWRFLRWRLAENLWHLDAMCACSLAWLNAVRSVYTEDAGERRFRRAAAADWLSRIEALQARAENDTAEILWRGKPRRLRRGEYLKLPDFLNDFRSLWKMGKDS